jgi:hypothetical protein
MIILKKSTFILFYIYNNFKFTKNSSAGRVDKLMVGLKKRSHVRPITKMAVIFYYYYG